MVGEGGAVVEDLAAVAGAGDQARRVQKAQVLGAEGQACVGEDLSYVGATKVEVEHPGVEGDPTGPWTVLDPTPGFERPPSASPYN